MARILCIDYGTQHCGIATSDTLGIIATPIATVPTKELILYLHKYFLQHEISIFLVGKPRHSDGRIADLESNIGNFLIVLTTEFPTISIERIDERFSSKQALRGVHQLGYTKKQGKDKGLLDQMSAAILLQEYLDYRI